MCENVENVEKCAGDPFSIYCPSKVSWGFPKTLSLYYSLIYGNCLGNVVMGMEKCGKMCENVENVEKCAGDPL